MEIAALILGIIAILLAWIPGCGIVLGGIPALVGLILAIIALVKKKQKKKQAIIGLILSILSFVVMIVAIIIIPLIMGVNTYNKAKNVIDDASSTMDEIESQISSQEVQSYNAKFEAYQGANVSGTRVRLLCDLVASHNRDNDIDKQVEVVIGKAKDTSADTFTRLQTSSATNAKTTIKSASKYTVTLGYDPDTGYVTQIGIQGNEQEESENELENNVENGITNNTIENGTTNEINNNTNSTNNVLNNAI